jgi:hypothetical protein
MPRTLILCSLWAVDLTLGPPFTPACSGQSVWSGFSVPFSKPLFADPSAPENQDRITENVWITRGTNQGLFNARVETGYVAVSPADTEWATALMTANAGETIAASNWQDLTFDDWITAYGGMGSGALPANLLANNAVVHLITDDVYLDLRFTGWSGSGGSFSYERAAAIPEPASATVLLIGLLVFSWRSRQTIRATMPRQYGQPGPVTQCLARVAQYRVRVSTHLAATTVQ